MGVIFLLLMVMSDTLFFKFYTIINFFLWPKLQYQYCHINNAKLISISIHVKHFLDDIFSVNKKLKNHRTQVYLLQNKIKKKGLKHF